MSTNDIKLTATERTDFGKGAARRYRREGLVPGVMYGAASDVRHVLLPAHETVLALRTPKVVLAVSVGGTTLLCAPRDAQRDPIRDHLLHLDLVLLSDAEAAARHAYSDALAAATAAAEEAGLDASQAAHIIEEAAAAGEDLQAAVDSVVDVLVEQQRAYAAASAAADAAEEAAAVVETEPAIEEAAE